MTKTDATLAVMKHSGLEGAELNLDNWLRFNNLEPDSPESLDAELLEVIPQQFHDEYIDRLRLHNMYERKFEKKV